MSEKVIEKYKIYVPQMISIEEVIIGDRVRKDLGEIDKLADNIKEIGLLNPITVSRMKEGYNLLAGRRRVKACKKLGWKKIPARILNPPVGSFGYIPCEVCDYLVSENHHIIPKSMGGSDLSENQIFVCPNHHHLLDWMVKIIVHLGPLQTSNSDKNTRYIKMLNKLRTADPIGVKFFERIIIPRISQIIKLEEEEYWGGIKIDEDGSPIKKTPPSIEYEALIQNMEDWDLP